MKKLITSLDQINKIPTFKFYSTSRFTRILRRYRYLIFTKKQYPIQSVKDTFLGKLYFPKDDNVIAPNIKKNGCWEPSEIDWLKKVVKPGSTCINVGANVGYFVCWMSHLSGPKGKVIGIEPNPELWESLKANCGINSVSEIQIIAAAAGNQNDSVKLFLNRKNYGDSRIFNPKISEKGGSYLKHGFDEQIPEVLVPMIRVADLINLPKIDVILVDTQGWDHEVIRGTEKLIMKYRPHIVTEFTPSWISDLGLEPEKILMYYESLGYAIEILGSPEFDTRSAHKILNFLEIHNMLYVNLWLKPV